ncbi:Cell wall-associated hydrolase, NlpC family [Tsukamurella pulmonis]|uniref:Cell wall-associated hydrolase, NlpC family n=2 Tax=Tsukamurella pulmonis TaxID=47312 RepID=A0A1H1EST7_9ACTN|nr:C40 family peptidase [Tsukamurella pulmonis]SDQ91803.1 Cell wall-associated hydrolase, NlpC family [Tsukamurella pulmonis]SUP20529.1 Peptidoglycan endopeptidase RipA precursor [Tsukamurella pulmonis]
MRRTAYPATNLAARSLLAVVATSSLVAGSVAAAGPVFAEPNGTDANPANVVAALVDRIAQADQRIADLRGDVASKRQSVNRAVVDLQSARDAATAAAGAIKVSETAVAESDAKIKTAQDKFDTVVRAAYAQGNSAGALINTLGGNDPGDAVDRASTLRIVADKQRAALGDLQAAKSRAEASRTAARAAKVQADAATAAAVDRKRSAEDSITTTVAALSTQEQEQTKLSAQRELAQRALDEAKRADDRAAQQKIYAQYVVDEQQTQQIAAPAAPAEAPQAQAPAGQAPAAQAAAPQAGAVDSADPLAAARSFAQNIVGQASSLFTNPFGALTGQQAPAPQAAAPAVQAATSAAGMSGAQMIETVIQRGMSVIGVQYAWGGGNAWGATKGVRDGGVADSFGDYNRVGFDCSGLMAYMYAAVGIALPKYSGYQYTTGNKVPISQLKRGDMVFRGPGGTQHVAMYLGNNQILESPQSGGAVRIAPFDASTFLSQGVRVINS